MSRPIGYARFRAVQGGTRVAVADRRITSGFRLMLCFFAFDPVQFWKRQDNFDG